MTGSHTSGAPSPAGHEESSATEGALVRHRARVDEVLPGGDPAAIKRLYVELGELLESATGGQLAGVPLLSLPETGPMVCRLLDGVGGLLLDAGCGPNPGLSILLSRRDSRRVLIGVDIGEGTVRLARGVARLQGAVFVGVVADLEALPFRSGAFDGAVCDDTIEHLPNDALGVAELARVVAGGGRVVLATPNRHSAEVIWLKSFDRLHGRRRAPAAYYAATSHLREYTWPELERTVSAALRVRRRAVVGWQGGWKRRLASRLTSRPPLRRLSRMVVIEAEPRPPGTGYSTTVRAATDP